MHFQRLDRLIAKEGGRKAEVVYRSLCSRWTMSVTKRTESYQECCAVPHIAVLVKQRQEDNGSKSLITSVTRTEGRKRGWEGRGEEEEKEDWTSWPGERKEIGRVQVNGKRLCFQVSCMARGWASVLSSHLLSAGGHSHKARKPIPTKLFSHMLIIQI